MGVSLQHDGTLMWSVRKHQNQNNAVFAKYRSVETTVAGYYILSDPTLKIKLIISICMRFEQYYRPQILKYELLILLI